MTNDEFMTGFIPLQAYFGKTLSSEVIKLYWGRLQNFSNEQFLKMVSKIMDTFKSTSQVPFPLIPDFLSAIGLNPENMAQAAVNAVKRAVEDRGAWYSVDFGDPALHAVINRFGGWPEICRCGNEGEWKFKEKAFMEAYIAALACGESDGPVEGNFEIGNRYKDQSTWNANQKKLFVEGITPKQIEWLGADFSHKIENKKGDKTICLAEIL